jgi:putative DNA primase/helicase
LDNQKAIGEVCNIFDKTLQQLSDYVIVEQHKDDTSKAHLYFYSNHIFSLKSSDVSKLKDVIDMNEIPAIEVKGLGDHGVAYCSPSPHKNGQNYEVIGALEPKTCGKGVEDLLFRVYKKHGLSVDKENKISIGSLFDEDFAIYEGHNRHEALLRIMTSLIQRNKAILDLEHIKRMAYEWNERHCKPPIDDKEFEKQWKCAAWFINKKSNDQYPTNTSNNQQASSSKKEGTELIEWAAEEIMSNNHFLTIEESKDILYYRDGVYIPGGETIIEIQAEEMLKYDLKNKILAEIKGHIIRQTYRSRQEIDEDINIINLRNGLYDIDKNELKPHSPHYYSINQKPIVYDPKAKPKMFGKFLSQVLYSTDIRTAIEVMAYTFHRDYPFEHFFKLFGDGANGKSVFTGLLSRLHDTRNVSNVSLSSLMDNRFAVADLELKDVNIDTELSGTVVRDTSLLKKLTGGSKQPIRVEQKYKTAHETILYAKLFFNANAIADSADQTDAFYRRQIIISFPNKFEGKDEDPNLLKKLSTKEEFSGIFNVLMVALRALLKNNEIYLNEKTIEERRAKSERAVNPVKSFIAEAIGKNSTEMDYVIKADLHRAYKKYCAKYTLASKSAEALGKELKNKIGWREGRESQGEKRRTCWLGVRLKWDYTVEDEQKMIASFA